ncbi:MAG: thioredoxin family protein [Candidatus Aenigmarchaeota archaeon]|nr:thioredoxin family protein [Candidatus Aenigmarchaeota archaeon]
MMLKLILPLFLVAVVFASACVSQQEQRLADGTMVKPDGTMIKPDGTMIKPDGTMVKPDGTMILPNGTMIEKGMKKENETMMKEYSGTVLAGSKAQLLDFTKADYDKAIASDKLVVLYFYADWCPICRAEVPKLYDAFNELSTEKVVGFRVNFNDGSTDNDERALAKQFGVPYQHTKVFLKNGQIVLKSPETWDKARYLSEINKAGS